MPTRRDVYLRIEPILAYSPVNPDDDERNPYRRDCLRNMDHEDGTIPDPEVIARTLDALVYREYVDGTYTTPDMSPLVAADINEPRPDRRVPSALIYTKPGERLYIHVLNSDDQPHSFHLHASTMGLIPTGRGRSESRQPTVGGATRSVQVKAGLTSLTPRKTRSVRGRSTTTTEG